VEFLTCCVAGNETDNLGARQDIIGELVYERPSVAFAFLPNAKRVLV
jgi:hypothetical protein